VWEINKLGVGQFANFEKVKFKNVGGSLVIWEWDNFQILKSGNLKMLGEV